MKNKQVLNINQMQHLQELGMKLKETMLYWVVYEAGNENNFVTTKENAMEVIDESCGMLPAYTLQDVLDALPRFVIDEEGNKYYLQIEMMNTEFDDWRVSYKSVGQDESPLGYFQAFELIDAAVRMLVLCYEESYVETNKNE